MRSAAAGPLTEIRTRGVLLIMHLASATAWKTCGKDDLGVRLLIVEREEMGIG